MSNQEIIKNLLELAKLNNVLPRFTNLKINGGIAHRINGKGLGKEKNLTDNDMKELKDGLSKCGWYFVREARKIKTAQPEPIEEEKE